MLESASYTFSHGSGEYPKQVRAAIGAQQSYGRDRTLSLGGPSSSSSSSGMGIEFGADRLNAGLIAGRRDGRSSFP